MCWYWLMVGTTAGLTGLAIYFLLTETILPQRSRLLSTVRDLQQSTIRQEYERELEELDTLVGARTDNGARAMG